SYVVGREGGQAVRIVRLRVLSAPDPDQGPIQDRHRQGDYLVLCQTSAAQVLFDPLSQNGQAFGELSHSIELGGVAGFFPIRVVDVLLAVRIVLAGGQQVATPVCGDPDVGPGGGNDQRLDPAAVVVADRLAVLVDVAEALAAPDPPMAGCLVVDPAQAGAGGEIERRLSVRHFNDSVPRAPPRRSASA